MIQQLIHVQEQDVFVITNCTVKCFMIHYSRLCNFTGEMKASRVCPAPACRASWHLSFLFSFIKSSEFVLPSFAAVQIFCTFPTLNKTVKRAQLSETQSCIWEWAHLSAMGGSELLEKRKLSIWRLILDSNKIRSLHCCRFWPTIHNSKREEPNKKSIHIRNLAQVL